MKTTTERLEGSERDVFPHDLSDWVELSELAGWIAETVEKSLPSVRPANRRAYCRTMLGTLAYCYCRGLVQSSEIERRWRLPDRLQDWMAFPCPGASAIRDFRRRHRAELEQILAGVLERAWTASHRPVSTSLHEAQPDATRAAEERVGQGVFLDSIYQDW